jgi:predicted ferric reductase
MKIDLLSLSLLAVGAAAQIHHYSGDEITIIACKTAISSVALFCPKDTAKSYKCTCTTPQGLGSWLNCAYDQTSINDTHVEHWIIDYCQEKANRTYNSKQLRAQYENATHYLRDITKDEGYNKSAVTYIPVEYKKSLYRNAYKSNYVRYKNQDWGLYMGAGMLGYWLLFFIIAGIYNFLNKTIFVSKYLKSHPVNLFRRYLTLPALTSNRRHTHPVKFLKVFGGFIPLRGQSIVIFLYFAMVVVFSATGYTYVENDTIWTTRSAQMARYPGDRTGILACFGFLLTFLFAGRNNFLIWLTGWKQSTFINFHKWVSRINFLITVVHAGSMHVQSVGLGKLQSRYKTAWMRWGVAATVICGILMVQTLYSIRKTQYELFLLTHIVLVAIFLCGTWIHIEDFGYEYWAYAMAAIWCFDRFVRIVRLAYFGIQQAQVTVVSDEVLKIVVPRHKLWKAYPGSFGYLHYLTPVTFWQSHPFTIIDSDDNTITFTTKIKGGVTSVIHRRIREQPNHTTIIPILLEGPYGQQAPVHKFNTVLYYTGSTGIPSSYAYIRDCTRRGVQQHIKLYWVIRNWKSLDWFYEELLDLKETQAQIIVYITDPSSEHGIKHLSSSESSSESDKNESEENMKGMPPKNLDFIEFRMGRPPMEQLVESDIKEANGNVAVLTCGHNSMVDDVRYSVAQNLDSCKGRVELIEELQVW